jgi:hypothetical protein
MAPQRQGGIFMRPPSIIMFERAYLASIALTLLNALLNWDAMVEPLSDPTLQAAGMGPNFVLISLVVGTAIALLLWYFIARRGSTVAKWIYLVLLVLSLLGMVINLLNPAMPKDVVMIVTLIGVLLQLYGGWLLFQPDAKAWLRGEWNADAATFD